MSARRAPLITLALLALAAPDARPAAPPPHIRADRHGDPLPQGAVARLGTVRFRHGQSVARLAFSPDGERLASAGGFDRLVHLWDVATRKESRRLRGHSETVVSLAFSPDGTLLASGSGNGSGGDLRLWEVADGRLVRCLGGPTRATWAVAFSPDGKLLASGHPSNEVQLWDVARGRPLRRWGGGDNTTSPISSLAFAPSGKTLAAAGVDGFIRLWDPVTGKARGRPLKPGNFVSSVAFSPDGSLLASGSVGSIHLWRVSTGRELRRLEPRPHLGTAVCAVAFLPGGKTLVSGGEDGTIRFWEVATGKELRRLPEQRYGVTTLAVSPDGKALVSSGFTYDRVIHSWDVVTGKEIAPFDGHQDSVEALTFLDGGKTVACWGGLDPTVYFWGAGTGKLHRRLKLPEGEAPRLFSPDGKILATTRGPETMLLRRLPAGRELRRFTCDRPLALSADGKRLAGGCDDHTLRVWDVASGKETHRFTGFQPFRVTAAALAPDGRTLVAADIDAALRVWDLGTGSERVPCAGHTASVHGVTFSPDGRMFASAGEDLTVRVWEVATGRERCRFQGHTAWVWAPAFSPDAKTLVTGSADGTVRVWGLAEGKELHRFRGHRGRVFGVAFSPDGRRLVSGSEDTTGLVWHIPAGLARSHQSASRLGRSELERMWVDLASQDALKAYRAVWALAARPGPAAGLLARRLSPVSAAAEEVARWAADLGSDRFAARERATRELGRLGRAAEPALRQILRRPPSPEARRRAASLLKRFESGALDHEGLRVVRSVEVLEHAGTPEARQVLRRLAGGDPEAPLTREARSALRRLGRARAPRP